MAAPVQVSMQFNVNVTGDASAAEIASAMAAANVPAPIDVMNAYGVTLVSDNTAIVGAQVQRTVVVSIVNPPWVATDLFTDNYTPIVRSASAFDTLAGIGAQQFRIVYLDAAGGGPHNATVSLAGKTPVVFPVADVSVIQSVSFPGKGSFGTSKGMLTLRRQGSGKIIGTVPPGFYNMIVPQATQSNAGVTNAKVIPFFKDWLVKDIELATACQVMAAVPVPT